MAKKRKPTTDVNLIARDVLEAVIGEPLTGPTAKKNKSKKTPPTHPPKEEKIDRPLATILDTENQNDEIDLLRLAGSPRRIPGTTNRLS